jgi:hypothetical protein
MTKWWRALSALALLAAAAGPARADLTLSGFSTIGSFGMPMSGQEQIMIHKTSVRRDFIDRGRAYAQLFDLATHQAVVLDPLFRRAEVYDLGAIRTHTEVSAPANKLQLDIERTGRKQALHDWSCSEYNLTASMPAMIGTEEIIFHLKGQVWIAEHAPEQVELKDLIKLAKRPDFFLTSPEIARIMPAQAESVSEMIRKMAPKGLPCAGQVDVSYEGNGPLANLARKLPTRLGFEFQNYSTKPIPEEAFAIPPGYQTVQGQLPAAFPR